MKKSYVLVLADTSATLETVGGKGLSLEKMINADLPVPDGFHITIDAYREFVATNELQPGILNALREVDTSQPETLEKASAAIRNLFNEAVIPPGIVTSVTAAYAELASSAGDYPAVAVRSSATAEDLPDASFAGQQETFLNIRGERTLLDAVKKCWASLWTARAIAYRIKNNIDQMSVALAVVVQRMVNAEAAGILFTANPMNGNLDEVVINAAWGLGEAIVGGLVSPDTIIVDKATGRVKKIDIAEKTVITVETETGTREEALNDARRKARVMNDAQVADLVEIARRIEGFYGSPQDIEWCRTDGHFYVVQSRPITTLEKASLPGTEAPHPTDWKLPRGAYAVLRNNIVELMADPLSPLFATLGVSAINTSLHRIMTDSFGMGGMMPRDIIIVVNQYAYNNGSISGKNMVRLLVRAGKIMKMMFTGAVERWTETGRPRYRHVVAEAQAKDWQSFTSIELVDNARDLTGAAIDAYGALVSGVIPAAWITEALFTKLYNGMIKRRGDPAAPTFLLGYDSLPIQSDKSLWRLAQWALEYPDLVQYLERISTNQLVIQYQDNSILGQNVPAAFREWKDRFQEHLERFGHTIYDLDFMHPVPADDPTPVIDAFKLYLRGYGTNPYLRQQASEERREQAMLAARQRSKGLRLNLFNKYLATAQKYAPLREDGLAEIGLAYPLIRKMLRELGRRFAERQIIARAEDVFWLTETETILAAEQLDYGCSMASMEEKVTQRKSEHQFALRAEPPLMLPQLKVFGFDLMSLKKKRGRGGKGDVIKGVAASPGTATGTARVLHGPEDFGLMQPGDVLVAPITTPAWTPLFAMASAVVTDIGGPLSHGSIVAREYGIPAVLGTGIATRRIQNGQTITIDGSAGTVRLRAK